MRALLPLCAALCALLVPAAAQAQRIKDIGTFENMRSNQLVGYGLVVGLPGTGDDSLDYATQAMKGVASRFGVNLPAGVNPALKNAAAVMITADLPAFAKPGQRLDITVSALGKAKSLRGGTLLLTPLNGADGAIYAMAQGNVAIGGLGVDAADGSKLTVNIPSAGRIAGGATVERAVANDLAAGTTLQFNLADADATTALRVADAINARMGPGSAQARDAVTIAITAPADAAARLVLMGMIEQIAVRPADAPARVIINARTGTVVINGAVRITPAAVAHGKLTVRVDENPRISQPAPFSRGQTAVEPSSSIDVTDAGSPLYAMPEGASLSAIVDALNALGASPGDLVAILDAMKQAGALRAELVIL
jgi:flagellar P-ring protein FlgI